MLTLLGLFGMFAAGVAADALLSDGKSSTDDSSDDPWDTPQGGLGNLLDHESGGDGPKSDDLDEDADPGEDLKGTENPETLSGQDGNDTIFGHGGGDLIDGRDGDDRIDAGAGNDAVWAGAGGDAILGGDGNDSLDGQTGNDQIAGGLGCDSVTGGEGDDILGGDAGNDSLLGGAGSDVVSGGTGDDWLAGLDGDDTLGGDDGSDIVDGGNGNDWISGLDGGVDDLDVDFLNGDAGNDNLNIGAGDYANGGEGADTFTMQAPVGEASLAMIGDYDVQQDQLVVIYDPGHSPDPHLTVQVGEDGSSTILLDGRAVAFVQGSPVLTEDIRLVPAA